LRKQLEALKAKVKGNSALDAAVNDLLARTEPIGKKKEGNESDFATIAGTIASIETEVEAADVAPTASQRDVLERYSSELRKSLATWNALRAGEVAKLDKALKAAGLTPIALPNADEIESAAPGSKELP
jgi:hypothetical protein